MTNNETSKDSIENILEEIGATMRIPKYLRELLIYTGFDNIISLGELSETDINEMERFGREDLPKLLEQEKYSAFYSIYAKDVRMFKIRAGHKKLLQNLIKDCKDTLNKKHEVERGANLVAKRKCSCECRCKQIKKIRVNSRRKNSETESEMDSAVASDLPENYGTTGLDSENNYNKHNRIVEHITSLAKCYIKKFLKELKTVHKQDSLQNTCPEQGPELTANLDKVKVTMDPSPYPAYAKISCSICDFQSTVTPTDRKYGKNWVLSNFNKHFKTHFKHILKKQLSQKLQDKERTTLKNSSILSFVVVGEDSSNSSAPSTVSQPILLSDSNETVLNNIFLPENVPVSTNAIINPPDSNLSKTTSTLLNVPINVDFYCDSAVSDTNDSSVFTKGRISKEACNSAECEKTSQFLNFKMSTNQNNSRTQRLINSLNRVALHESQTKITEYYSAIKDVQNFIEEDSSIKKHFLESFKNKIVTNSNAVETDIKSSAGLLDILKKTAQQNSNVKIHGNRFCEPLKLFGLYIFIIGGRLLYETLYSNLSNALPSITTLNRTLDECQKISEGAVRLSELKEFLLKRKYPMRIFISEDQTAILKRVQYDPKTNKMVGFQLPLCKKNGFPTTNNFYVNSIEDIRTAFQNETLSNNAYVFMAQPLVDKAPAFCVAIYGSENRFDHNSVLQRWKYLQTQANMHGIHIEGFSSDGDARCLKAMKISSYLPLDNDSNDACIYSPYFKVRF